MEIEILTVVKAIFFLNDIFLGERMIKKTIFVIVILFHIIYGKKFNNNCNTDYYICKDKPCLDLSIYRNKNLFIDNNINDKNRTKLIQFIGGTAGGILGGVIGIESMKKMNTDNHYLYNINGWIIGNTLGSTALTYYLGKMDKNTKRLSMTLLFSFFGSVSGLVIGNSFDNKIPFYIGGSFGSMLGYYSLSTNKNISIHPSTNNQIGLTIEFPISFTK